MRNIWIYRLISEAGLPSYKVDIPRDIVYDMEDILKDKMPVDQDGYIIFENFLPILGKASLNGKVWITGGKFIFLYNDICPYLL